MNKPGRRISSLEAAGVKSISTTTSSNTSTSTTTTTTKKKLNPQPISTKKTSHTSLPPTLSSYQRSTKTQVQTKDASNNSPPVTPFSKKRSTSVNRPNSPIPTVRSASRASNRIIAPSSRNSASNSSSATSTKQKLAITPNIRRQSTTGDSLAIEELKDKNKTIQKALAQKEQTLIEKEKVLNDLKEQLKQLQNEIKLKASNMQSEQETTENSLIGSEMKMTFVDDNRFQEHKREQELSEQLQLVQQQMEEKQTHFEEEKSNYVKKLEDTEKRNREITERLRERHEDEKIVYNSKVLEKDREIEKLKKDMDEMRNDIRDMHQSHQTRLTTLTNQLNHQHIQNLQKIKSDYEERLNHEDTSSGKEYLKCKQEVESKTKDLETLQTQFDAYQTSSQQEKALLDQQSKIANDLLQSTHKEEIEVLVQHFAEIETDYKAKVDHYQCKLQMSNEEIQQLKEDLRKEGSVQHDVTLLLEKHSSKIEELKKAYDIEKTTLKSKLEEDYSVQLKAEIDKLSTQKDEEFEMMKTKTEKTFQAQIKDIEESHKSQLIESRVENSALNEKIRILEGAALENDCLSGKAVTALEEERRKLEDQLACDRLKYEALVTKYDVLNTTLLDVESKMIEKNAEFQTSISQLETKHNLIIKNIKEVHENTIQGLKNDHAEALKLSAGCNSITSVKMPRAEKELYEDKIKRMNLNEHLLNDAVEKLYNQSEQFGQDYMKNPQAQKLEYSAEINKLKEEITKLTDLLKSSNDKYNQSMQELKNIISNETLSGNNLNQSRNKVETLNVGEDLDAQPVKHLLVKLLGIKSKELELIKQRTKNQFDNETTHTRLQIILEQHQKELSVLQNQFQNLLDMKDKELSDLFYKMKSRRGSNSTGETCGTSDKVIEQELRKQVYTLEDDIKSKSLEMRWLESDNEQNEIKIKDQGILIRNLQLCNDKLEGSSKQLKDENEHMLRQVSSFML